MNDQLFIPGIPISLELPRGQSIRFNTSILGCKKDAYIFLEYPTQHQSQYLPLEEEEPCIIRFVKEGKVYGFQSYIAKVIRLPFLFLLVKYPESIDQINLRQSARYGVQLESTFSSVPPPENGDNQFEGLITDISDGGCLLVSKVLFPSDTILLLSFNLPEVGPIENLESRITRVAKKEEVLELGVCFSKKQDPSHQLILKYIDHIARLQIMSTV